MKVCVLGLWHLGTVIAACLAARGFDVIGLDADPAVVGALAAGRPPLFEPGLADFVGAGLAAGRLRVTTDVAVAVADADVVWIACDTPVDDDDRADVESVVERAVTVFPHLQDDALVLISSQVPVGTTRRLEQAYAQVRNAQRWGPASAEQGQTPASGEQRWGPASRLRSASARRAGAQSAEAAAGPTSNGPCFAYSPENLRLGNAIEAFTNPARVVVGVRSAAGRERVAALFTPFTDRIEWMSVESAEMTKHALNAFLATSVTFINEIATLCEQVGADAAEVGRGLKSDPRIGPKAYLSPGGAFAGGTLARDVVFLSELGQAHGVPTPLVASVKSSNDGHRQWARRRLAQMLGGVAGQTVAIWGLTYKPGTDTLRRSSAVELCQWLHANGAVVQAHDPAVGQLPADLAACTALAGSALGAVSGASALVVATPWPEYRQVAARDVATRMTRRLVLDASRFLGSTLGADPDIEYVSVGQG